MTLTLPARLAAWAVAGLLSVALGSLSAWLWGGGKAPAAAAGDRPPALRGPRAPPHPHPPPPPSVDADYELVSPRPAV